MPIIKHDKFQAKPKLAELPLFPFDPVNMCMSLSNDVLEKVRALQNQFLKLYKVNTFKFQT